MTGAAQNSARIHGVVTDADGQPVEGASVTMEFQGGLARQYETMTNDDGEFMQIGLMRGPYSVTASKEEVGALIGTVTLRAGQVFEMNMELLRPGDVIREGLSEEELERIDRAAAATDAFGQGLDATRSGDLGKAITLFNQALGASPDCADCHRNLGIVYGQMKDYGQAETAFKAALALKPDDPASYDGLAGIYNAQQRFDDAAEASAAAAKLSGRDAAGGGDAAAVFDQGLIFWNAGRLDDARQQFERTVELDPDHGEVHYWLGMGNLNGGQIPEAADELRLYLDREPAGRFAEQARGILAQIQP
jgi:tetratricopeptide (TPR) repeat protein